MTLGNRIKKMRKKKNLTQEELAELLFISSKAVSSYELNRTEPSLDILTKMAEIFECNISYLIYGETNVSTIETEIKIKLSLSEFKRISEFLEENALFLKETRQIDTYFNPTYRSFLDNEIITEWLRIGNRGNKKILNYKNWHDKKYCDEYEVEIDNDENLIKIFDILGIKELVTVDKKRCTYMYLDKYEIALDKVINLGYFIEIEVKKLADTPIEEYEELIRLAKKLQLPLKNMDKRGYPYHLIFKDL